MRYSILDGECEIARRITERVHVRSANFPRDRAETASLSANLYAASDPKRLRDSRVHTCLPVESLLFTGQKSQFSRRILRPPRNPTAERPSFAETVAETSRQIEGIVEIEHLIEKCNSAIDNSISYNLDIDFDCFDGTVI